MDPEGARYSMMTKVFFLNLRRFLIKKGITIDGLFHSVIFLKNPNQINQVQFVKLVGMSESKFSSMQIYQIFNELKQGSHVSIANFVRGYNAVDKVHSLQDQRNQQMKSGANQSTEQNNREVEKKMIRVGLVKLQKYVRENQPIQLFKQCDDQNSGELTKGQFNKFMIATDIKQLNDTNIRHVLIKKIFSYYPNGKMRLQDFLSFFKIAEKEKKPEPLSQPVEIQENKKEHIPFKKAKVHDVAPVIQAQPQMRKQKTNESIESNEADFMNAHEIFPQSYSLYRLGMPVPEHFKYFQKLEAHLQAKKVYADRQNPATHLGKYEPSSKIFHGQYQLFQMAASVMYRQKSRIGLAREIQPKDIMQGQVGDCYFLSSMASVISFYPEVVSGMFLFGPNPSNYYVVRLFIDGQWVQIQTDDQFPCDYGRPVFAKPHGKQIWVMLLEKCWAKVFGSYNAIDSGTPTEGFRAITGAPAQYITADNKEEQEKIYKVLEQAYERRYVATASGSKYLCNMSSAQQESIGLIGDHAYSFLKFLKINGETVVKMRNPWGKTVWKGDWSCSSKKWTPELREKFNYHQHTPANDGAFYMPWDEFTRYFSNFVVCRLDPTFLHTSHRLNCQPHKSSYFKMSVKEAGIYDLSVYQQSKRKYQGKNYEYCPARFVVLKDNGQHYSYICSANKSSSHVAFSEAHLERGNYFIAVKMQWGGKAPKPVNFTAYGCGNVSFEELDNSIGPIFKKEMIRSFSQKFPGKAKTYEKLKIPEATSQSFFSIQHGLGYIKVKNPSNRWFKSTMTLNVTGLKIIKPDTLPHIFNMDPGSEQVIGFWVSSKGYSYQSSQAMQTKGW